MLKRLVFGLPLPRSKSPTSAPGRLSTKASPLGDTPAPKGRIVALCSVAHRNNVCTSSSLDGSNIKVGVHLWFSDQLSNTDSVSNAIDIWPSSSARDMFLRERIEKGFEVDEGEEEDDEVEEEDDEVEAEDEEVDFEDDLPLPPPFRCESVPLWDAEP